MAAAPAAAQPGRQRPVRSRALELFEMALDRMVVDLDVDIPRSTIDFEEAHDPELRAACAALIGTAHRQEGDYSNAAEWLDRAVEIAPPGAWCCGFAMVLKAELLASQGFFTEAIELIDKAASFVPQDLRHVVHLQHALLLLQADRHLDAERLAVAAQAGAAAERDSDRWALGRVLEGRANVELGRLIDAEVILRSLLLRSGLPDRIDIMANGWLGIALTRAGVINGAIERMEDTRPRLTSWPRGALAFGPAFAATYLDANLLDLAALTAETAIERAVALNDSVAQADALMVLARVEISQQNTSAALAALASAQSITSSQDRPQLTEHARRLVAALDPVAPPDWLRTDHFCEDPSVIRALLATAAAHPECSATYLSIAAAGTDASVSSVRVMARFAMALLNLEAGRVDDARRDAELLLEELRQHAKGIDALDVRAAAFEIIDLRGMVVAFAQAGAHETLFAILAFTESGIFDFGLTASDVGAKLAKLEALSASVGPTSSDRLIANEADDLDRRVGGLRRVRAVDRPRSGLALPTRPKLAFVETSGRLYRASFGNGPSSLVELEPLATIMSLIRRLRFAVTASGLDPIGSDRIDLAADSLQAALFRGLGTDEGEFYSIRPGRHLISVPWRLLPLGHRHQLGFRISSDAPHRERAAAPRNVLSVACLDAGGLAEAEARAVGNHYPSSTLLAGPNASPHRFLDACSDHDIIHIAGYQALAQRERLVTTLHLDGGPISMFDLGQIPTVAPVVVVASSRVNPVGSTAQDVNLALAHTLIARGAQEVVVSPIDLAPEVGMVVLPALHELLADGRTASAALDALSFDDDELQRAADCLVCIEAQPASPSPH